MLACVLAPRADAYYPIPDWKAAAVREGGGGAFADSRGQVARLGFKHC